MMMQQSLFSASLVLLLTIFSTTTTTVQLSPVQAPASSPTTPTLLQSPTASPPAGFNTVPLVPSSPNATPTPSIPKAPTIDIVQILKKAKGFSVLIHLLKTTQLINQLNSQLMTSGSSGLTFFTPQDSAFSKLKPRFLNFLSDRQKVELFRFHILSSFISISSFNTLTNPVQTQAGDDPARLQLNITTYGGSKVSIATGTINATITSTVYADNKLAIYEVDKVLLPLDVVLPKPKAPLLLPSPSKGDSDKNKSSAEESGDGSKNSSDDDGSVSMEAYAGSISFNVKAMCMWMPFIVGLAYVGGAMI